MRRTLEIIEFLLESQVAKTILDQFGGKMALVLIGGKAKVVENGQGIGIKWPNKQRSKGNYVEIVLKPDDTYEMTFFNGTKKVKSYDGVYADQLQDIFEKQTGWYLTMGRRS
jgi:hypothetical protein